MRTLNAILTEINTLIGNGLLYASNTYQDINYYNQAALQETDGQTRPIVNSGDRTGIVISPTDYKLNCYHRVIDSETQTNQNGGYGKYPYRMRIYTIRNVWIGEWNAIPSFTYEFNDDVKNDVYSAFPIILSEKERIFTINESVDKQAILEEEFAGYDFKNLNLELIAFYIQYEIHQRIRC